MSTIPKEKLLNFVLESITEVSKGIIDGNDVNLKIFIADSVQRNFLNSVIVIDLENPNETEQKELKEASMEVIRNYIAKENPHLFEDRSKRVTVSFPLDWLTATTDVIKCTLKKTMEYNHDLQAMERELNSLNPDIFMEDLDNFLNEVK